MDDEDSGDREEEMRYKRLGFKPQKEVIYNKLLPYADQLDDESVQLYTDIKTNLVKSVMLREIRPGCVIWTSRLNKYMKIYGLKFSKEDHITLIKLFYDLVTIPDLEPTRVNKFATTLTYLLKKKELIAPSELQLEWRPLYKLCQRIMSVSQTSLGMYRYFSSLETNLDFLIHSARIYFPASATQEMLDEWRPKLCPFDNAHMISVVETLEWFLPIALPPEQAHLGYELWFNDFMDMWEVCHNAPPWEADMMWLMARLATYNVGYINWEPYVPLMFTRFLRSLDLPVSYRAKQSSKHHKIETSPMAIWIVFTISKNSSTLKYLEKFMQTLESYYHPANNGRWTQKLRELFRKLPFYFVQRCHRERYKKSSWETQIPKEFKFTDADIDQFVGIMQPIVFHAIYSRHGTTDVCQALQHLATLRPKIIVPLVLDKIHSTLDSLTEPHKLTAAMQCLVAVARPMVQGPKNGYAEGPTHVIPLLVAVLPGIDPNDVSKCFVTFQFISTFISMIPIMDSSSASEYWKDLTEEEHVVCEASAGLEDFVLQFFDKVFTLIEGSSLETTRLEQVDMDKRSRLENMAESALSSICMVIATQTSAPIFKSALRKLYTFVTEHIFETKVSGRMLATMCRTFTRVNAEDTLKLFVPHLSTRLHELLAADEMLKEENLDNEILYNLLILSELVDCSGTSILPYIDQLIEILDRTLHLTCPQGSAMSSRLLDRLLNSLTVVIPLEYRSANPPCYRPVKEHLSIRDWGKPGNINNLGLSWYQPADVEINAVQNLLNRYLPQEIECLNAYIDGTRILTREELRRTLYIVLAVLGSQTVLPMWQETAIELIPSRLEPWAFEMMIGTLKHVTMPDGSNVRQVLTDLMHRLQAKILRSAEDDTKSLFVIIAIWDTLLMNKFRGRDFETHWKKFHMYKKLLEDRLRGNKSHLRQLLVDRVMLQQEFRTETRSCTFTETHKNIIIDLYTLCTSHYSEVRMMAQKKLFTAVGIFPYAYTVLTPYIKESLRLDTNTHHEEFKGCLYVLLGPKSSPIVTRHDWMFVHEIWPHLVMSKPSEKPSVINLMTNLVDIVHKFFPTIAIRLNIPEKCVESAAVLGNQAPKLKAIASAEEIKEGINHLELISAYNKLMYEMTMDELLRPLIHGNLHWRYHTMALSFIRDLVHPEIKYNEKVVNYVLQTLIHDSLELRKIAMRVTLYILKQHKPERKKIEIDPYSIANTTRNSAEGPGPRADNAWVQYNSATLPHDQIAWNEPRYLHKQYSGYYCWPKVVEIYAPSEEPRPEERTVQENQVSMFFASQTNVDKFIRYLSMEEKKGRDKFNGYRFVMFKNLFRNHGNEHLGLFIPHLERMVMSKEEQEQRCASEIIAALIRGSKHWSFDQTAELWTLLTPIIQTALSNMTVETVADWGICFATASESRDPNRLHWLLELLMEKPIRDEASFIECGRLYTLQGALNQQLWRVAELFQRLFVYLQDYLDHPFQNVRERISSILANMFEIDLRFPNGNPTNTPRVHEFIDQIMPRLNVLYLAGFKDVTHEKMTVDDTTVMLNQVKITDVDKDVAIRLFKTVCKWIISSISRANYGAISSYYNLFPLACLLQSYEADEELSLICSCLLAVLSQSLTLAAHIPTALATIAQVADSPSWSARAACSEYIQVFVFHNMATLSSNEQWIQQVKDIVFKLLEDDQPEVRIQASQVIGGLLHCQFIPSSKELLDLFKQKARTKLKRQNDTTNRTNKASAIRIRHSGVLGMCSFINAHPYDVPDYLPEVFLELGAHLNDPQPIPATIRKTLGDFKRTHHDNWELHQLKFTEDQLSVLSDLTVPPSYFA